METPVSVVATAVPEESSATAVSWAPIIAGALAASAATLLLMLLGSGLGLTMISPWSNEGASLTTIAVSTAIWLVLVQWISAGLAGYMAGRLRTKWVGVHTDEVFFRDTAHGFLAWALATLLVAGVLSTALTAVAGTGVAAVTSVASGAAQGAATGAAANASTPSASDTTSYFVDALFRPANAAAPAAGTAPTAPEAAAASDAQAARILLASAATGEMAADDRAYLEQLVAARTGLSAADAKARVDQVIARIEAAKAEAKEAADSARKASATLALLGALSLVIGAFIAAASAALGGRLRDDEETLYLSGR